MEILATISALLGVVDLFLSVKDKFRSKPNKNNLAIWLNETADLIESAAEDLKNRIYPHSKCAQLNFYLQNFYSLIKDDLNKEQADKVLSDIDEAYKVERLLGELNNLSDDERENNLIKMYEISGSFRALADFVELEK